MADNNTWWKGIADGFGSKQGANALIGLGTGLLSGNTFAKGLAAGGQGFMQGAELDQQYADEAAEKLKETEQTNVTRSWLEQQGFTDLVPLVDAGQADIAYGEALKRMQPGYGQPEPLKPTSSMQEYEYARSQGYQGTFQDYETAMKQAGATNIDFNQNQGVAAGFADRMAAANAILEDPKLTQAQTDMMQSGLGAVPLVGNFLTSEEKKMADQAQRDFVNAILRRESGAVISPSEFENAAQQYFPQPGDTPAVIEQKRQNRLLAMQGVQRSAGPSYQPPPTMGADGVVDYTTYFGGQ